MDEQKQEKLYTYLDALLNQDQETGFPIGSIIYNKVDLDDVLMSLSARDYSIIELTPGVEINYVLSQMVKDFLQGNTVVLHVHQKFGEAIYNQLNNLMNNNIDVHLAGDTERTTFTPGEFGAALILLVDQDIYDQTEVQKFASSACYL